MWTERLVTTRETRLNVATTAIEGTPIVLLHGVTRRWQDWLTVTPWLAQVGQLHALDHRGHGKSARGASGYQVIDYVNDAVDYVKSLSKPAVLVGHSLGGMVAAGVAAAVPDHVNAIVLEDPTFAMTGSRIDETGFPDVFRAYLRHAGSSQPVEVIAGELAAAPVRVPGKSEPVPFGSVRDAANVRWTATCLKVLDPAVLPVIIEKRWLDGFDVDASLRAIHCPCLFLQGEFALGGALPDNYAAELRDAIADCTFVKLPNVGHNIHGTQPAAMMTLVVPFLTSILAGMSM
jgi:pimeloyl-ACP methyl ester carboxylesterase